MRYSQENYLQRARQTLMLCADKDDYNVFQLSRMLHFNTIFHGRVTNLLPDDPFVHMMAQMACSVRLGAQGDPLQAASDMRLQSILVGCAVNLCKHNSPAGAAVYRAMLHVLDRQQSFLGRLDRKLSAQISGELLQNGALVGDFVAATADEAFALALRAASMQYGKNSLEVVKVRLQYAVILYNQGMAKQSAEQLGVCEAVVGATVGPDCRMMGEINNFKALLSHRQGRNIEGISYYEKAIQCFWKEVDKNQIEFERLNELLKQLEIKVQNCGSTDDRRRAAPRLQIVDQSVIGEEAQDHQPSLFAGSKVVIESALSKSQFFGDLFSNVHQIIS